MYLMLDHGYTPEKAMEPFMRLHPCPLTDYVDATWCKPTYKLAVISCLRGLYKAVGLGLVHDGPLSGLIDTFDCLQYENCDNPSVLNMNQVCIYVCSPSVLNVKL